MVGKDSRLLIALVGDHLFQSITLLQISSSAHHQKRGRVKVWRTTNDSSALLVKKAHQQNTWKIVIFKSLDVCYAIAVPQDQKASLLQAVEFYWLRKGQKRAQGIGSEGLL
jgi:hypothetical protein